MATVPVKKQNALKGKGGLVAVGVVALLGVWLLADLKKPVREPDQQPPVSDFVHASSDEITRIEVKRAKDPFVLTKQGDQWLFQSPGQFRANGDDVKSWMEGILEKANVSQDTGAKPTPDRLASYGLDKPVVELVVMKKSGETRTLQLGKEYPGSTGAGYYAREAKDGRLFLVSSMQAGDLKDKKSDDLRDKRLLEIAEDKDVRKLTVRRASDTIEAERQSEDKWRLTQPIAAPADKINTEALVGEIRASKASSFADTAAADLTKYGLDKPVLTVQVVDNKGTHTLLWGKTTKDANVYAMREGAKDVFLVPKSVFDNMNKKVADLRDKHLLTLESDKINYLEIVNGYGSVKLRKTGATTWEFVGAPDPKQKQAKADRIQTVLTDLTGQATKYVEESPTDLAKYGLDKPPVRVIANDSQGTSQVFQVGKKSKDGYYARGATGPVFEIQNFVYDDLNVKPDAFKDTPPAK